MGTTFPNPPTSPTAPPADPGPGTARRRRRRRRLLVALGAGAAAIGAWLFFGFFGFHTLFFDEKVDEAVPIFASGGRPDAAPAAPADGPDGRDGSDGSDGSDGGAAVAAVEVTARGEFASRSHPGRGEALVLSDGTQRFLRFEDFATDNGPDLNVYLSSAPPDAEAAAFDDDFVDLGDLKGNEGDQNYELPPDVDLERYSTVVVWCVRFDVAFTVAGLA